MLKPEELIGYLERAAGRQSPDAGQRAAILAPANAGVRILAGPGTGKTTCIVTRMLKLVLCDGVPASGILAMTFTRKAADEMRSRVLGDGFAVIDVAREDRANSPEVRAALGAIDLGQVQVGTIDSFCARWAREGSDADDPFVAHVDDAGAAMAMEEVVRQRFRRADWRPAVAYLHELHRPHMPVVQYASDIALQATALHDLWRRRLHDRVDWTAFLAAPGTDATALAGRKQIHLAHREYASLLKSRGAMDHAMVQEKARRVLAEPVSGSARRPAILEGLRALFVDEYHDTDLLHQAVYFALAAAPGCRGAITIVGDDDQAIYRFRGGTVDLLADFPVAYHKAFGRSPETLVLDVTYRATPEVAAFVERFGSLDDAYQLVRSLGRKELRPGRDVAGAPVLGLFRPTLPNLAHDIATLIRGLVHDGAVDTPAGRIVAGPERAPSDVAMICRSPQERDRQGERLPAFVRRALADGAAPVAVWNPRGAPTRSGRVAALVGGLALRLLDPEGDAFRLASPRLLDDAEAVMRGWCEDLAAFLDGAGGADPTRARELIRAWDVGARRSGGAWESDVPVVAFLYELAGALPDAVVDVPEFAVAFGLFLKQAEACRWVAPGATVIRRSGRDLTEIRMSAVQVIVGLLGPVADGRRRVEDEGPDPFPRNRVPILSIHQSKGLEFPVVIVDAGCFLSHRTYAFQRMPETGAPEHRFEKAVRPFTELGGQVPRSDRDVACDDLIRSQFVAYSRARDLLILVGLSPCAPDYAGQRPVPNLATGWTRDGLRTWAENPPMVML
jgi:DNA helicase-2/ATP-dependent DNA helicase PcrA